MSNRLICGILLTVCKEKIWFKDLKHLIIKRYILSHNLRSPCSMAWELPTSVALDVFKKQILAISLQFLCPSYVDFMLRSLHYALWWAAEFPGITTTSHGRWTFFLCFISANKETFPSNPSADLLSCTSKMLSHTLLKQVTGHRNWKVLSPSHPSTLALAESPWKLVWIPAGI